MGAEAASSVRPKASLIGHRPCGTQLSPRQPMFTVPPHQHRKAGSEVLLQAPAGAAEKGGDGCDVGAVLARLVR